MDKQAAQTRRRNTVSESTPRGPPASRNVVFSETQHQQAVNPFEGPSTIPVGPSPFLIARKKLPWLNEGSTSVAKNKSPTGIIVARGEEGGDDTEGKAPDSELSQSMEPALESGPTLIPLGGDPSLREIGSAPSLRDRSEPYHRAIRTLSLSSDPRPGIKPTLSMKHAQQILGVLPEKSKTAEYSPSEYSAKLSSEEDGMSGVSPKGETTAYSKNRSRIFPRKPVPQSSMKLQSRLTIPSNARRARPMPGNRSSSPPLDDYEHAHMRVNRNHDAKIQQRSRRSKSMSAELSPRQSRARKQTLHQLPMHLVGDSSSSSSSASSFGNVSCPSSPELTRPATIQPPAPVARRVRRDSKNLNRAVTGLENLMEEALKVAKEAAQSGRSQEVSQILDSATLALRKSSTVNKKMELPLAQQFNESGDSSDTDSTCSDSEVSHWSVMHNRQRSDETVPTLLTNSAQSSRPVLITQNVDPVFQTADFEEIDISGDESISNTPPRLYEQPSVDSIVRDFAYSEYMNEQPKPVKALQKTYGAAADYYGDMGESVTTQPGVRKSIVPVALLDKALPKLPTAIQEHGKEKNGRLRQAIKATHLRGLQQSQNLTRDAVADTLPATAPVDHKDDPPAAIAPVDRKDDAPAGPEVPRRRKHGHHPHVSDFFESSFFHHGGNDSRKMSTVTDASAPNAHLMPTKNLSLRHPRRKHISLREGQGFSLGRYHRRQPIAREWKTARKRITATIACFNTVFIGLIAGIYAGEVPGIQYQLADLSHKVILGNVLLFIGLALTTMIFWPLPLLHGRKPYTLMAFALMLPLQFPQALAVSSYRDPNNPLYRCGLLIPRILTGLAMGFANINQLPTLFDLFGVSLMSARPHQEVVQYDDVRRQGGGVGLWLGIWSWCFIGSLSIGFCIGACIISTLDPAWGFYIVVILLAFFLLVNVIAPETRRAPYRRSIAHFLDNEEKLQRRVARGEVKLHVFNDGPKWWFQEVWAGMVLSKRMFCQPGYFVLMLYIAWIYCQVTAIVLLLGALLSRDYQWQPQFVGLAVLSLALGALLAVPLAKASIFSRSRFRPQRTDSMTMQTRHFHCSSHLTRRCLFTFALPFAGLAYTLSSPGTSVHSSAPIVFCGLVGFLSNLAIAECVGLIMETFDTCDLQPGVNTKHRLQSMSEDTRRRRTNYSSFPRVCAGFFCAQGLGFFLAAAATGISGDVTRALGAQTTTAIVAAILLVITVLLMLVLWRYTHVQVTPSSVFGALDKDAIQKGDAIAWGPGATDPDWKPVVIGNPSGKMRRVNLLELGSLSRWTEIRKLNRLIRR